MTAELSHDEQMYVASARLFANNGTMPYIDYPYFHMPNMIFIYGFFFKFTNYNLLTARAISIFAELITLFLVLILICNWFDKEKPIIKYLMGYSGIIILFTNDLYRYISGYALNHSLPIMFALLGFFVFIKGINDTIKIYITIGGFLVGIAAGIRITFILMFFPFLIYLLLNNAFIRKERISYSLYLLFGFIMSLVPSILIFCFDPNAFIFGNLTYHKINYLFRLKEGCKQGMNFIGKIYYFYVTVLASKGNPSLFIIVLNLQLFTNIKSFWGKNIRWNESYLLLLIIIFLAIGCFAPSPSFFQYFYAPVPFILLVSYYIISKQNDYIKEYFIKLLLSLLVFCCIVGLPRYIYYLPNILNFNNWTTLKIHNMGLNISKKISAGKVLTLGPIAVLEGGGKIYKEFVTGPFAWRVASLISEENRKQYKFVSKQDLDTYLRNDPPSAILVGYEGKNEDALINWAMEHNYHKISLQPDKILWVK